MEFLIAMIIAGVVAFFVVQDASGLRDEEIAAFGSSTISPGSWGAGVFLMAVVFLPAYIIFRISRGGQITQARIAELGKSERAVSAVMPAPKKSPLDEVAQAHELLQQGGITQQEFDAVKARVLS